MATPMATPIEDTSSSDESGACEVAGTGKFVTELNEYDVLLGRGTGPNNNGGNVKFRDTVEGLKSAYISTASRKAKNRIVRKTVEAVKAKKGRFLSKLKKREIKLLGLPHKSAYEIVTDSVAVEKTKQALRYICYKKDANQRNESSPKLMAKKADSALIGDFLPKRSSKKLSSSVKSKSGLVLKDDPSLKKEGGTPLSAMSALRQPSLQSIAALLATSLGGNTVSAQTPPLLSLNSPQGLTYPGLSGIGALEPALLAALLSRLQPSSPLLSSRSVNVPDRALLAALLHDRDMNKLQAALKAEKLQAALKAEEQYFRLLMLSRPQV